MEEQQLTALFALFSKYTALAVAIPIVVGIWKWRDLLKPLKVFWWFRVVILMLEGLLQFFYWYVTKYYDQVKDILTYWQISDTNFLGILFHLTKFIFIGYFYYLILPLKYGKWILRISVLLSIAAVINYLFIEGYRVFGIFSPNAVSVFAIGTSAFYLWHLTRKQLLLPFKRNPYYWLSLAILLPYLAGIMISFIGDVTFDENFALFVVLSIGKNVFFIISYFLMAIGFYHASYAKYLYPYNR